MHSFKSYQKYLCAGVIASLAACQSQDGNNTAPPTGPTAEQIGTYVDSAVQGLSYETPSRNGVTSSTGAFEYLPGEAVLFRLSPGGAIVGRVKAVGEGFVATPINTQAAPEHQDAVVNLARTLQALDTDSDLDNGIQIDGSRAAALDDLDFDQQQADFETDVQASGVSLPTPQQALAHVYQVLCDLGVFNCASTVDFRGTDWDFVTSRKRCALNTVGEVAFGPSSFSFSGDTSADAQCQPESESFTVNYDEAFGAFSCLNDDGQCTVAELNAGYTPGAEGPGDTNTEFVQHTPGSGAITVRVIDDQGNSLDTVDRYYRQIDIPLLNSSWAGSGSSPGCPAASTRTDFTFGANSVSFSLQETNAPECVPGEVESGSESYAALPFLPPCLRENSARSCTLAELNRRYTWEDFDDPQSATGIADSVVEFRYELEDINSPLSATWIWVTYNYDAQNQRLLSVRERLELRPAGN